MSTPAGIDPRGPRFAATITAVLLLVATFLALIGISTARLLDSWFAPFSPVSTSHSSAVTRGPWAAPHSAPGRSIRASSWHS